MFGRTIPFVLFAAAVVAVGLLFGWGYAAIAFLAGCVIWLAWEVYTAPLAKEVPGVGFVVLEERGFARRKTARRRAVKHA